MSAAQSEPPIPLKVGLDVEPTETEAHQAKAAMTTAHWQLILIYRQEMDTANTDDIETLRAEMGTHTWIPDDQQVYHWGYVTSEACGQHPLLVIERRVVPFVLSLQALMVAQEMGLLTYMRYFNAMDRNAMTEVRKLIYGKKVPKSDPLPTSDGHHLVQVHSGPQDRMMIVDEDDAIGFAQGLAVGSGLAGVERLTRRSWTFL